MALLTGYTGSSLNKFGRSITLALGDSAGVVATTISADATFDLTTATVSAVNGGAASRNVTAVAEVEVSGMVKVFINTGTTDNLVIRSSAPATLVTLAPSDWCVISYTGSAWTVARGAVTSSAINAIALTDNLASALDIKEASTSYLKFVTTNSGEKIVVGKTLDIDAASVDVATQATTIAIIDNTAAALDIAKGANSYLKFVTTNAGEKVTVGKALDLDNASLDLSTQATVVSIRDNEAAALDISEGANVYLRCVTTNSGEQVVTGKPIHHAGGIAAASVFTSTEQTGTGSSQNVAHGLGSTPSLVWFAVSEDPAGTGFDVAPGAHDATNCVFTVTTGVKFFAYALK